MKHLRLLLTVLLLGLLLSACTFAPYPIQAAQAQPSSGSTRVFVVSHGWHTGLVIPAAVLEQRLPDLKTRFGKPAYYEIGWGDQGFYQAHSITAGLTLQAMLWSRGTVLHVVGIPTAPCSYFPNSEVVGLAVDDAAVATLGDFVAASFRHDSAGKVQALKHGIYGDSQFYAGVGRYGVLNTCNTWAAKGLRSMGLDIFTPTKLTAGSVLGKLEPQGVVCR